MNNNIELKTIPVLKTEEEVLSTLEDQFEVELGTDAYEVFEDNSKFKLVDRKYQDHDHGNVFFTRIYKRVSDNTYWAIDSMESENYWWDDIGINKLTVDKVEPQPVNSIDYVPIRYISIVDESSD